MAEDDLGRRLVDVLYGVHGEHPGHRAAHAKGRCLSGSFTASAEIAALTIAAHLQGDMVPVTARFSNGSGSPSYPDYARDGRGLAVKFHLPDGSYTDMVGLTLPVFFVRTPEDFLEFMRASVPVTPGTRDYDLAKIGAFLAGHPETQRAFELSLREAQPESYARRRYNGIHTFMLVDASGVRRPFRYRWEPEAGDADIDKDTARAAGRDYLQEDIRGRLEGGTVVFTLLFSLGEAEDPVDDPTVAWPDERQTINAGRMELAEVLSDEECAASVFDPTTVTDGIETSADPVLHARSLAYSVSIARRKGLRLPHATEPGAATGIPDPSGDPSAAGIARGAGGRHAADRDTSTADRDTSAAHGDMSADGDMSATGGNVVATAGIKVMQLDGARVAIAQVGGRAVAFQDACTHRGCSLSEGVLEGGVVTCPCHGSQFDVTTGAVVRGPARDALRTFAVPADLSGTAVEPPAS